MNTILVVDDDADVRATIMGVLVGGQRRVLGAADGYEAVRLLAEHPVDLLITDVRMPGINGFQLARQARLMRPKLHIVYISAYHWREEQRGDPVFGAVVKKPFRADDLMQQIERELAQTGD